MLAAALAALGLLALAPPPMAQAAQSGWGQFTFTGTSRSYTGTLTQQAAGFPRATLASNSIGGGVGVQSGASTWLSTATDVGAKYGSSRNQGYLNLRPYNQNGAPPSVTTYTFERPTPSAGWTFVLGDVDADQVTITATGPGGVTVDPADLGFRSVFNYCTPGVCTANTDVPSWNPATGVLQGRPSSPTVARDQVPGPAQGRARPVRWPAPGVRRCSSVSVAWPLCSRVCWPLPCGAAGAPTPETAPPSG